MMIECQLLYVFKQTNKPNASFFDHGREKSCYSRPLICSWRRSRGNLPCWGASVQVETDPVNMHHMVSTFFIFVLLIFLILQRFISLATLRRCHTLWFLIFFAVLSPGKQSFRILFSIISCLRFYSIFSCGCFDFPVLCFVFFLLLQLTWRVCVSNFSYHRLACYLIFYALIVTLQLDVPQMSRVFSLARECDEWSGLVCKSTEMKTKQSKQTNKTKKNTMQTKGKSPTGHTHLMLSHVLSHAAAVVQNQNFRQVFSFLFEFLSCLIFGFLTESMEKF